MSVGGGFGVGGSWGGWGWVLLWKIREKGKGLGTVGGGVGTGKGTGKSMRPRLSKLPSSNLPFSFSPMSKYGFVYGSKRPNFEWFPS